MPSRTHSAIVTVMLTGLLVCGAALAARAGLVWEIRLENPPVVVGPTDTVVIKGVLFNSPTSDRNLGVISGGSAGEPPGFDFEIGAIASAFPTLCSGWQFGPDGSLQEQFQGVDLAPGQIFNFVFGKCIPPAGGYDPGIFGIRGELQLLESSAARPMVGTSFDIVRWLVSDMRIDIIPGSEENPINSKSDGKIPVAILSSPTFNAPAQIDQSSLTFGRTGEEPSLAFCDATPEDVNGDGFPDLLCHFYTQTAAFQKGDTQGLLKGKTDVGRPFFGVDSISIVPAK